jgi:hypothetical protein
MLYFSINFTRSYSDYHNICVGNDNVTEDEVDFDDSEGDHAEGSIRDVRKYD